MNKKIINKFKYDTEYTRRDVATIARPDDPPKGGDWDTCYSRIDDLLYVFINIDTPGRTGHEFANYYDTRTQTLLWFGSPGSKSTHKVFQGLLNGKLTPLFFYRYDNRDPFKYLGSGKIIKYTDNYLLEDKRFCLRMIVSIDNLDEVITQNDQSNQLRPLSQDSQNDFSYSQEINNYQNDFSEDNELKTIIDSLIDFDSIESVYTSDRRIQNKTNILLKYTKIEEELLYDQLENLKDLEPWNNAYEDDLDSFADNNLIISRSVDELELSVRSSNCLRNEGIELIGDLIQKTGVELSRLPNMGKKSLLEIKEVLSVHDLALGTEIDSWNNKNSYSQGKVYQDLTDALLSIKDTLSSIERMSLKQQLFDPINISPPPSEKRKYAISQRYGIPGEKIGDDVESVLTLEQVGKQLGVTRERVRQLQARTERAIRYNKFWMPKLQELLCILENNLPISEDNLITYLVDNDYGYFTIKSLQKISELYQIEFPFAVKTIKRKKFLTSEALLELKEISAIAEKICSKTGFVQTNDLSEYLEQSGLKYRDYNPDIVKKNLIDMGNFVQHDDTWFSSNDIARNRFENVIRVMAHCVNPINIKDIREGMKRAFLQRKDLQKVWPWLLAPSHVMLRYCQSSPHMDVSENGDVYVDEEFVQEYEFAKTFRQMRDLIKAQPNELIDHRAFYEGAIIAGINPTTFNMYCTFQPFIERFARGVWGLRGSKPSSASIEAVRDYSSQSPRKRRKFIEHFNDDGNIEIITRISRPQNFILSVNLETASNLGNEKYMLQSIKGISFGEIHHVPSNECYFPIGKGLIRIGAEEDDFIKVIFDLTSNVATIELVPESIIWEYDD